MTTRLLPSAEWPRLAGTLLDPAWQGFNLNDRVVVTENAAGEIVGCFALMQVWHLEGAWIDPRYRGKVSVGRRLYKAARDLCRAQQVREVYMMARSERASQLCRKLGDALHLACDHFLVRVQ